MMNDPSDLADNSADTITPAGRAFVWAWAVGLIVLGVATGYSTATAVYRNRLASNARHLARIDPNAAEPGKTEAETSPPPGSEGRVPIDVRVGIYVDRIVELSVREASWTVDFYIWFNWADGGLKPGEQFQVVDGRIESREKLTELVQGGEHYELYRVMAQITKVFDVSRFPADDHLLTIHVESTVHQSYQLRFVADTLSSNLSSRVKVPGYEVHRWGMVVKPHSYRTTRGDPRLPANYKATYSQLIFGIWLSRPGPGYYFKVFQGLYAAAAIALVAFLIKPTDVDPRFGLGVGAFFAAVANTYITSTLLPDTGIMTMMDLVNGIGMATIFLTLVQSTISLYLYDRMGREALSRLFDVVSFVLFLVGYTAINVVIPLAAAL